MSTTHEARTFELGGWRGRCQPQVLDYVLGKVLPDPEARARAGDVLRESRYRVTARLPGPGGQSVLLKAHQVRKPGDALRALVQPTRAQAEWDAATWLLERGLPAPRPLAVGERRAGRRLESAFLLTEFVQDARALRHALEAASAERRLALLAALGGLVRRMHDAGFDHRDLHAENVLVTGSERPQLVLVDLHRHRRGRRVSRAARVRALGRLVHDLGEGLCPGEQESLLGAWIGPQASDAERQVLAQDVAQVGRRLEKVRRRSRARRCLLESTVYTLEVGSARGARRRDLALSRLEEALRAHDEALAADDERVVKRGRKSAVTRHGDLVVKEGFPAGPTGRVKDALAPSRRSAGYQNAHLLDVLGVATARPLAWVQVEGRDLTLYEDLSRLPRLDRHARDVYRGADRPAQRRLRDALADWLAALHARGIYHGDLKGVNVLVRDADGRLEFPLIDTDRVRFFDHPVDRRRVVKNLAQLAASIPQVVSRSERLRWLRRYAAASPRASEERALLAAVDAAVRRKIVVVDEPIE